MTTAETQNFWNKSDGEVDNDQHKNAPKAKMNNWQEHRVHGLAHSLTVTGVYTQADQAMEQSRTRGWCKKKNKICQARFTVLSWLCEQWFQPCLVWIPGCTGSIMGARKVEKILCVDGSSVHLVNHWWQLGFTTSEQLVQSRSEGRTFSTISSTFKLQLLLLKCL